MTQFLHPPTLSSEIPSTSLPIPVRPVDLAQPSSLSFRVSRRTCRSYQDRGLVVPHRYVLHLPTLPRHLKVLLRDVPCAGELGVRRLGSFVPYVAPALPERRGELGGFLRKYQGWTRRRRWESRITHGLVGFVMGALAVWGCG